MKNIKYKKEERMLSTVGRVLVYLTIAGHFNRFVITVDVESK